MAGFGKTILGLMPHLLVVLALLLYLPWALGVPGTPDADYADGWYLGFYALNGYITAYAVLGIAAIAAQLGVVRLRLDWVKLALRVCAAGFALVMALALVLIFN